MKKKWVDIRIGEHVFTVRCVRTYDSVFGNGIEGTFYPLHNHPTSVWERFIEMFKYPELCHYTYYVDIAKIPMQDWLVEHCQTIIDETLRKENFENQWNNL